MVRIFEGRFGRLLLSDLDSHDEVRAQEDPVILLRQGDPELVLLNPGKSFRNPTPKRALVFHIAGERVVPGGVRRRGAQALRAAARAD